MRVPQGGQAGKGLEMKGVAFSRQVQLAVLEGREGQAVVNCEEAPPLVTPAWMGLPPSKPGAGDDARNQEGSTDSG